MDYFKLAFECSKDGSAMEIEEVRVYSDTTVHLLGRCPKCETTMERKYDVTEMCFAFAHSSA